MQEIVVKMQNIVKSFHGVRVLKGAQLELRGGEVMALLGENGAGKSTLMKILSGVYTRDSGELEIFGSQYGNLSPTQARELGIAMIHQELNLCRDLTVTENIFLGREYRKGFRTDDSAMKQKAEAVLREMEVDISPGQTVGDLPLSKQQMVEIAKALAEDCRVLIMDEPTSSLTVHEIETLFRIIHKLKERGCAVVYISHRLEELRHIADRVTIMRDGQFVMTQVFDALTMDQIIASMVGHEITVKYPTVTCEKGKKILEVEGLEAGPLVRNINLSLYEGEIVGIAGLVGAGRTETTRAIFGIDRKRAGKIFVDGKRVRIHNPRAAIRAGIVLAPEDRQRDGLCTQLSVQENLALPNLKELSVGGLVLSRRRERRLCEEAFRSLQIRASSAETQASHLSGGNQQKVVVGKWTARKSRVVIFDEPTRGMDVGAKVEIYHLMNRLKQQGIGVLFVSSEMPEILGIADRILVMCDGRITGELSREEATQEKILTYAMQFEDKLQQKNP